MNAYRTNRYGQLVGVRGRIRAHGGGAGDDSWGTPHACTHAKERTTRGRDACGERGKHGQQHAHEREGNRGQRRVREGDKTGCSL